MTIKDHNDKITDVKGGFCVKIEDFNRFMIPELAEDSKEKTKENIMNVKFNFGDGPVITSVEEIAKRYDLDLSTLLDYMYKFEGNINLAALAAQNDKRYAQSFEYLKQMLGICYIMSQNPQEVLKKYNNLLRKREQAQRQFEFFIRSSARSTNATFRVDGKLLRLLMLKTKAKKVKNGILDTEEKATSYASLSKIKAMEGLIKIANHNSLNLTEEELIAIRRELPKDVSSKILADYDKGIVLTAATASEIYELFELNYLTTGKNVEVFEQLCDLFELKENLESEKEQYQGGLKLTYPKNNKQ